MNTNILIISSRSCGKKHVSYNTVLGLEDEFSNCIGKEVYDSGGVFTTPIRY